MFSNCVGTLVVWIWSAGGGGLHLLDPGLPPHQGRGQEVGPGEPSRQDGPGRRVSTDHVW